MLQTWMVAWTMHVIKHASLMDGAMDSACDETCASLGCCHLKSSTFPIQPYL